MAARTRSGVSAIIDTSEPEGEEVRRGVAAARHAIGRRSHARRAVARRARGDRPRSGYRMCRDDAPAAAGADVRIRECALRRRTSRPVRWLGRRGPGLPWQVIDAAPRRVRGRKSPRACSSPTAPARRRAPTSTSSCARPRRSPRACLRHCELPDPAEEAARGRSTRSLLCRSRRADRPHHPQERRGADRRHASARRRRGRGLPPDAAPVSSNTSRMKPARRFTPCRTTSRSRSRSKACAS